MSLKRMHALLRLTNMQEQKEILAESFSGGRTQHCKELTDIELLQLLMYLQSEYNRRKRNNSAMQLCEKMRRYIISMAYEMGWEQPNGKADMWRIDNWCKQQFGKKELSKYTYPELPKLVSTFKEKLYKQFLASI